jgi:hypothetical protein
MNGASHILSTEFDEQGYEISRASKVICGKLRIKEMIALGTEIS